MRIKLRRFLVKDDAGAATVETALWIPFFVTFMMLALDSAAIFANSARIQWIANELSRDYATGSLASCADLESEVETRVQRIAATADATCTKSVSLASLVVQVNTSELDMTGATGLLGGMTISLRSLYKQEFAANS